MSNEQSENEPVCCPKFNPEPWDGKVLEWQDKKFIKDHVKTFMYMPINFGGAMMRLMEKVEAAGAQTPENMCLSDHTSKWNMDLYLAVDKEIEGAEKANLSGKFLTKVYEGDFKDTGKWGEDFKNFAVQKGLKIKKWYMWYTTCPKCAKKYGRNYVVTIAEVE
ncbi:TPA: hypothetical protein DD449_01150 [Candidatus Berkelbacteria bacterium]|uniref:Uncharacterized protein n=1 Tax=Berkelbacteria bacterium GW2011_GWE1_39_12 TaxID=1618337 RepID=A0A0G4B438_9BACT|nr:MAG: hypothetical protein UT28_C0001G0857 [Berkelbacteria bacterium GW2011_GWE1_39_12]HBO60279.1 hypothetical protein [Candidatus Berkelbacteria bacterium]